MARARSIKPGFFRDRKLLNLPPLTRLLFAGLWTVADRDGRLEDDPEQIKLDILPYDKCKVHAMLQALADQNFILRYQHGSQQYIQIRTWAKHQNPHKKEPASSIPSPSQYRKFPEIPGNAGAEPGNSDASRASSLTPSSLTADCGLPGAAVADWPLAVAAVQKKFPLTDQSFLLTLIHKCVSEFPPLNDPDLADAVTEAHKDNQKSAGLYLTTVPQVVKVWATQTKVQA